MIRTWIRRFMLAASLAAASAAAADDLHKAGQYAGAPLLAYIVSQHSPALTRAEKTVLSQDFNGAPLDGERKLHTVTARAISCRGRSAPAGHAPPRCAITFGEVRRVRFGGEDGARLFDALGKAGAGEAAAGRRIIRRLRDLNCTVDDKQAQGTPSSGDDVAGFACTFRTAP